MMAELYSKPEREAMPYTIRLNRVLTTRPEKVYRAFLEPDALAKWLPPDGFACTVHHLEPKTGGTYRASFRNFTTGDSAALGGEYIELVPNERLRFTDKYKFEDPQMTGDIQITVTLKPVSVGTELAIVQEGLPDFIDRKSTRLNSSHLGISYAVFCLKTKKNNHI